MNRSSRKSRIFHGLYWSLRQKSTHSSFLADPNKLKSKYDVVILGAGHNGLVAANYLAKSSQGKLKICVLERRHVIGGAALTEEIIPGFKFSRASYLFSLFRPTIIKELDLMRHGILKLYNRDPSRYTPLLEGDPEYTKTRRSLLLGSNSGKNRAEIAKFSKRDAETFEKYEDRLNDICSAIAPLLDNPPIDVRLLKRGNVFKNIQYLTKYMAKLFDFKSFNLYLNSSDEIYRLMTSSAADILDEWFESDILKGYLATDAVVGTLTSPYSNGSAYVLLHHVLGGDGVDNERGSWAYVEGGMGAVSQCLAYNTKSYDDSVEIYTSQEVKQIVLSDSKAKIKGVELSDGKLIEADYVLSNATPHVTFKKLLNSYGLEKNGDDETQKFFKRVDNINYESGVMKLNLAVSKLPNFLADPNSGENKQMPHHQCSIFLNCHSMKNLHQCYIDSKHKIKVTKRPMMEITIPSSLDPTVSPKGQHVVQIFAQHYPFNPNGQSNEWKDEFAESVLNSVEEYAPGFKSSIIGKDILTPLDLENIIGLTGGNIFHGAMPLNQLFINRPVSGWCNYDTPINGLYLAGSGAHPGGGVMGSPGRLAALRCFEDMKKQQK